MDFKPRVSIFRGDIEESIHFGAGVVVTADGKIIHSIGNPDLVTFPRSALKFIQAITLIESQSADAYQLTQQHLSLACASHVGEDFHIDLVNQWLKLIGLTPSHLACGPDYPSHLESRENRLRSQQEPNQAFHNCSGKHTAFLTVCQHLELPVEEYQDINHPVQKLFQNNLQRFFEQDVTTLNWQVDGCTFPAPAMRLYDMAYAMAKFSARKNLPSAAASACETLANAIGQYPEYMSGQNELAAVLTRATEGRILAKIGAEGYYIAIDRSQDLGIAVKIADGSVRGVSFLLVSLLDELNLINDDERIRLKAFLKPVIYNSRKNKVGDIRKYPGL